MNNIKIVKGFFSGDLFNKLCSNHIVSYWLWQAYEKSLVTSFIRNRCHQMSLTMFCYLLVLCSTVLTLCIKQLASNRWALNINELYATEAAYGHPVTRSETDKCVKLDGSILYIKWFFDSSKCKKRTEMAPCVSVSIFTSCDLVWCIKVTFNSFFKFISIFFCQPYFMKGLGKTWR